MNTYNHSTVCPKCKAMHTRQSAMQEDLPPRPGDLTVCFGCSEVVQFDQDMDLIILSAEEYDQLDIPTKNYLKSLQKILKEDRLSN